MPNGDFGRHNGSQGGLCIDDLRITLMLRRSLSPICAILITSKIDPPVAIFRAPLVACRMAIKARVSLSHDSPGHGQPQNPLGIQCAATGFVAGSTNGNLHQIRARWGETVYSDVGNNRAGRTCGTCHGHDLWFAFGQRPGLVHHERIDLLHPLQRFRV
jgi:hypothetical protein